MKFQFNVKVDDRDYLEYNKFWMFRSPYGKKQIKAFRIAIAIMLVIVILITLFGSGFSLESVLGTVPMIIVLSLFQIFLNGFFSLLLKLQMKALRKSGKMGYSPESVVEFYEDGFAETTPENKTEHKYSAVERISVVDDKMIYIHVNNVMSYMLPTASFESKEQYNSFFDFIKTKCDSIDVY